jgi:Mn2+/Fe2+ NRAMP family transporter
MNPRRVKIDLWSRLTLGFIVAATGVGAGDLLTASLAGSAVGLSILWAAWVGAWLKFVLNEGLARWQMATGQSILEGWFFHLPRFFPWLFFVYFFLWAFYVGGALINACGVAGVGFFSMGHPGTARIIWGIAHSLAGLFFVWRGGFHLFQRLMTFLTAAMVLTVLSSVIWISPSWPKVLSGLVVPRFPHHGLSWLLGVMGGVGGTVTIICYNYWVREKGRKGLEGLKECRLDLAVGYGLTAFFGLAMVIIGSKIVVKGRGDEVALQLAEKLGEALGPAGKGLFLLGFWSAVFSSLLGVWQGVPYIFADFLRQRRASRKKIIISGGKTEGQKISPPVPSSLPSWPTAKASSQPLSSPTGLFSSSATATVPSASSSSSSGSNNKTRGVDIDASTVSTGDNSSEAKFAPPSTREIAETAGQDIHRSLAYRLFLIGLTLLPLVSLLFTVQRIQLIYAVLGALFMPFLAATLLLLNNRKDLVPASFRNTWVVNFFLGVNLIFFSYLGWRELRPLFSSLFKF